MNEFDKWASQFYHDSDEWEDMDREAIFKAGMAAASAQNIAKGDAVAMGDLRDEEGDLYKRSILIQFDNVDDFGAAVRSGQCRFTVFGGEA